MNPFKDTIVRQGASGRYYTLHWKNRFGPLAVPLMVAGIGMQAYGQYEAGQAEQDAANYNAKVLERQAQAREQKGLYDSRRQAEYASRQESSLRAGLGGAGAVMTEGSPLMIQSEQAEQNELDNLLIGYDSAIDAQTYRSQAEQQKYSGKIASRAGKTQAFTTLLTGFGSMGAGGDFNNLFKTKPKPGLGSSGSGGYHQA